MTGTNDHKIALVTGAGSGIGRAVAIEFASSGYLVALCGRNEATLQSTAARAGTQNCLVTPCDVSDEHAVEAMFDLCIARFGRIDVLVNSAGQFGTPRPLEEADFAEWHSVIGTNLNGSFLCARAAYRRMKEQTPQGGRIINCGSISAHAPRPWSAAYTASKHAITGLTRSIALEGRAHGIAATQLDIGNAATSMTAALAKGTLQADGSIKPEPMMDVATIAATASYIASLPPEANVLFMTVMATNMPFVGRG